MRLSLTLLIAALVLSACAGSQEKTRLNKKYGEAQVRARAVATAPERGTDYWSDVRPILESRCVVCHGCWDSPCQLKLGAPEGIDRGASKDLIYDPARVLAVKMTRLFEDASSVAEWREKAFHPVLNERSDSEEANLEGSVLYQMLALKKEHPLPEGRELEGFDFSLDREQTCPTIEEFKKYKKENPTWGMPYGLPGLTDDEFDTITRWIEEGAEYAPRPAIGTQQQQLVAKWEAFLNGETKKQQLVGRYIYEHWFLAHLRLVDDEQEQNEGEEAANDDAKNGATADEQPWFKLVRSKTPPGKPIEKISTRRPFDDPKVERPYYRLARLKTPILVKNHMAVELDDAKMKLLQRLFVDNPFKVNHLPGYEPVRSANPFYSFVQIPVRARYKFLLEDARFTLQGFIKGPVCRGQSSLNVIDDRFWIFFADPNLKGADADAEFYAREIPLLDLPAGKKSNALLLANWLSYSKQQKKYLTEKIAFINERYGKPGAVNLDVVWDGGGTNPNAALTVMRHEDSATVVRGLVGAPPKTSWIMGYGILERIHYLLVAGFDVYGNVGHQVVTRLYMDFLRMEAEFNFLAFLPKASRNALRDKWYEGAEKEAAKYINGVGVELSPDTAIKYESMNPQLEFYDMLQAHVKPVASTEHLLGQNTDARIAAMDHAFSQLMGGPVQAFPQVSFLRIDDKKQGSEYYTLIRDNSHSNILSLFSEEDNLRPDRDRLTLVRGLLGAYPNAFFRIDLKDVEEFTRLAISVDNPAEYSKLKDRFGVRRNDKGFWQFMDALHAESQGRGPVMSGLLDLNRLENR